jgi:hypothetical protein
MQSTRINPEGTTPPLSSSRLPLIGQQHTSKKIPQADPQCSREQLSNKAAKPTNKPPSQQSRHDTHQLKASPWRD